MVVGTLTEPVTPGPFPIVLILHGMGGDRQGPVIRGTGETLFGGVARIWARRGVASLRISTGGRGGSEGDFVDMTLDRRVEEALGAIKWIVGQRRFDGARISILGHSQGTLIAASAAKRLAATIPMKSVVLWAPQESALPVYKRSMGLGVYEKGIAAKPDEVVGWIGAGGQVRAFKRGFFAGLADFDAVADIAAYGGPTLVVTGDRDQWSPPWRARAFEESGAVIMTFDVGHRMGADMGIDAVHELAEATLNWLVTRE